MYGERSEEDPNTTANFSYWMNEWERNLKLYLVYANCLLKKRRELDIEDKQLEELLALKRDLYHHVTLQSEFIGLKWDDFKAKITGKKKKQKKKSETEEEEEEEKASNKKRSPSKKKKNK